ncbi:MULTISPECIES: GNAT family N-acetyltransferase [Vibrio]|uniref:GNAT family N-acetyltransferase n=1 Tax=Vibrio TaxID=662 RepID=UPI0028091CE9|nr:MULTISPECIES: GNAT family N-acetyltransferase [unclassified Vibrio]ELA8351674.1 GNAT family N-acetyltransferase [Vibrio alginolyticus]MDW1856197.1 GNAT family N-acetyltransferase [Vibrio sp. Vb0974]MDW2050143.1 GNAT family N-acetyltransferase [Vibrio sp. 977]
MQIREVRPSDAQSVLELMYQLDRESKFMMLEEGERTTTLEQQVQILESFTESNSKVMFVISNEQEVCGFAVGIGNTANRNRHSMYCVMGIRQSASGCGYGKQLLDKLEIWALEHEFTRLELTVMCHNVRAFNLYRKHGFEVEGTKRNSLKVDGKYINEFYMSKLLHT